MPETPEPSRHTTTRPVRVPQPMWDAYGRVCKRLETDRTNDLLEHMRDQIKLHGDSADLADLSKAENELALRRTRRGGRPRRSTPGNPGGATAIDAPE